MVTDRVAGRRCRLRVLIVLAVVAAAALSGQARAVTLPPGFTEATVFGGLQQPTAVRFSSDGRVFVAEKSGLIKVFSGLSDPTPDVFADLRPKVHDYWDRGLLSIALHPQFPSVASVYALYTHDAPIGGTAPRFIDACADPTGDGCVVSGRLSRLAADGSEQVLVEGWCQQYPSHSIGSLAFGPDGALYVSGGDGASFNFVDYGQDGSPVNPCGDPPAGVGGAMTPPAAEGGALRSQDLRTSADPAGLNGAVLRLDPTSGLAMSGNPLSASGDPNARRIIAYGLRNPFRMTFRPGTSELWVGDVGWSEWEEINRIAAPTDGIVENFGWPCYEGQARQPGYDGANLTVCEDLYAANAHAGPYFTYKHRSQIIPNEACPIGGSSIAGLAFQFYTGGAYPPEYDGALFFADYSRDCIWVMQRSGGTLPSPANIKSFVGGASNPVELQMGPGNDLYYVDIGGGTVRRISYTAAVNRPPVAAVTGTPTSGQPPLAVSFDGSASRDPDGDALRYAWDLDGNGAFDNGTAVRATWTYSSPGRYVASLRVTDTSGAADTESITISVGLPTVQISAPLATRTWSVGESISFSGSATDNAGNQIPPSGLRWSLIVDHGACPACHEHVVQTFSGVASGSFSAPDHDYPSSLRLVLTATDSSGLQNSRHVALQPRTTILDFATAPTGLSLTVNGSTSRTPFSRTVITGSTNSISAPSPQQLRGKHVWERWSDGGAQTHTVVAPATRTTYTATYRKR